MASTSSGTVPRADRQRRPRHAKHENKVLGVAGLSYVAEQNIEWGLWAVCGQEGRWRYEERVGASLVLRTIVWSDTRG